MPRARPPYPQQFKIQIIELARNGRTPSDLADEFEPTETTIYQLASVTRIVTGIGMMLLAKPAGAAALDETCCPKAKCRLRTECRSTRPNKTVRLTNGPSR